MTLENDSKDKKIKALNEKLSVVSDAKGNDFIQALNNIEGDMDIKTKQGLMKDISDKSHEILQLKDT